MQTLYMVNRKAIAYLIIWLLVFHLFFSHFGYERVQAETPEISTGTISLESTAGEGNIPKQEVTLTYSADSISENEIAYRVITREDEDGNSVIVKEGEVSLAVQVDGDGLQWKETYSGIADEDSEGVWVVEDGTYTVSYYSKDTGSNVISDTKTCTFTIDSTAPNATLICKDADGLDSETIACAAMVSDEDFDNCIIRVYVRKTTLNGVVENSVLENEILENAIETELTFTEEGSYQIYLTAEDGAGNITTTGNVDFIIDKTKPDIFIDAGEKLEGGIYNTTKDAITFTIQVSDFCLLDEDCRILVTKDGVALRNLEYQWTDTTYTKTTTLIFDEMAEDGSYTIKVSAKDKLQQRATKEFSFEVDNTVIRMEDLQVAYDAVTMNTPIAIEQDGIVVYYLKNSVRVSAYAVEKNYNGSKIYVNTEKDGEGVESKIIDMSMERQKVSLSYSEEGSYTTNMYGEDSFGNESDKQTIRYVVDKTAPELFISQVINGVEQDVSENQLFSADDNRKLRFVVKEQYHNKASYKIRVERKTDLSVNTIVTVLDASDIEWSTGEEADVIYYEDRDLFSEEGQYTVTISGKDLAGNQAADKKITFYVDSTAPVIAQRSSIINGKLYNEPICFQYDIKEFNYKNVTAQITVQHTLDGITHETKKTLTMTKMQTSFEYVCEEQGEYKITVTAIDEAGNEAAQSTSEKGYTIQFVIDKKAPVLSVTGVSGGLMTKTPVYLTFEAIDRNHDFAAYTICVTRSDRNGEIETFELKGKGKSAYDIGDGWNTEGYTTNGQNPYRSSRTLCFSKEGMYQITFNGTDKAHNMAKSVIVRFSVDKTAPVISDIKYSDVNGLLTERYHNIYSNKAILVEFSVKDQVTGVDEKKVYITVGDSNDKTEHTAMYIAHKSVGDHYYVYIPTDVKVSEFDDTITIWAGDILGNESFVTSAHIVYRTAKPELTMECDVDYSQWTNKDITFHTTATDRIAGLKEIIYKVNGKTVKKVTFKKLTYTYEYDVVASEEASKMTGYTVSVEVTNNSGTKQTAKKQVYIDKTSPTVKLSGVEKGVHYRSNQMITTDVSDVSYKNTKTVYYITRTLDGKTTHMSSAVFKPKGYHDSCNRKMIQEGRYKIYAIATDGAGNKKKSNTLSFVVDKTAPEVNVSGISEGAMSGGAVTLQFECVESFFATNEVKIQVEKELDGEITVSDVVDFPNHAKRTSLQKTFGEDGTYHVTIAAMDKAGNVASSKSLNFSVDMTRPELKIVGTDNYQMWDEPATIQFVVEESYYSGNHVTITGTRRDANGNVTTVEFPDFVNTNKISTLTQLFSEDGTYEFEIMAKDKAGNESSRKIHFTIDQTMPEINGIKEYNGGYYRSFQLAESMADMFKDLTVVSYRILLNGVEYNGTDTIWQEGKYHLYIEAEDELGHANIQNVEFIIDHTTPKVIFTGVKDGEIVKEDGSVSLTLVNEEDVITGIRMNGVEYATDTRKLDYSEYGSYRIEVDCEDRAGNSVTRELYFIYSDPMTHVLISIGVGALAIGLCFWLWICARKKERKE